MTDVEKLIADLRNRRRGSGFTQKEPGILTLTYGPDEQCIAAADALAALQAENEQLRWEAKCLGETLDAWFDRRKLGHDAVDQAVVDAASGYLRTSRVGGMSNEESDMILDVIQDMARLGLFADLFARAALKGETP